MKKKKYIPHPKHVPFEYSKITEYVYLGTNQCCQYHFKKMLLDKGIKADISVEKERLDAPFGVDYFLWLPVEDHKAPSQKQLLVGASAIRGFVDNKLKVYVHCKRGHGRSPVLVAAYFILEGMKAEDAIRRIRAKRRVTHLTLPQISTLKRFEKKVG
jgi:hypothetical protein